MSTFRIVVLVLATLGFVVVVGIALVIWLFSREASA